MSHPPPAVRFVLLAVPRTGSNWLCTLLGSHPEILCHHEIFNPDAIHYALDWRDGTFDFGSVADRDRDPLPVLDRTWRQSLGFRVVGFKLNRGQNPRVFDRVLEDRGVRKILVLRRNRIKTHVSELVAERTGEWESYPGMKIGRVKPQIEVDVDHLRAHIARNQDYYDELRRRLATDGQQPLEVTYEELPHDHERRRILDFLGVAPRLDILRAATRKQNPKDLRQLISNFDQLAETLTGSELEDELHSRAL